MVFELSENVEVHRDENGTVRLLRHPREAYSAERAGLSAPSPTDLADQYVRDVAPLYGIDETQATDLDADLAAQPTGQQVQLHRAEQKTVLDTVVVSYEQTVFGLPIWQAAIAVRMFGDPLRVVSSSSTLHLQPAVDPPPSEDSLSEFSGHDPDELASMLDLDPTAAELTINSTRLLVYQYEPAERIDPAARVGDTGAALQVAVPTLALPPVPDTIEPGRHYVVREVLFTLGQPDSGALNWRVFVELSTRSVFYLRALVASATACIFPSDPVTLSGSALTGCSPATALDPLRVTVSLTGLEAPDSGGHQALRGEFVAITDTDPPTVAPPTTINPFAFSFSAPTNDFAAASAYVHYDGAYRLVQGMGFDIGTYFDGTVFPVPVDHQGFGTQVNAQAAGNTAGNGMGRFRNGLAAAGCPVGIAADVRVPLHEFGHALLWDHVGSPNFGWCHSAGDTLGALLHDPGSKAPDRFATFPFIGITRRHDRDVAAGWAWGGTQDDTQYGSEQILSTLLFRVYRCAGGDDISLDVRRSAARYLAFLIVKAIGTLTVTSRDPASFATALMDADESTTAFEGHPGGAWHKVIRWSFEQQGLYQPPGAPRPVTTPGAPPAVDVYIDDGRNGGYSPYLPPPADSADIWVRRNADGGGTHEEPVTGQPNYIYVRVHNRGTNQAANVSVRVYGADLTGDLTWSSAWAAIAAQLSAAGPIPPDGQAVVGPFPWTPTGIGLQALLASASAPGDLSNADTVNGSLPSWLLASLDNNVAQRTVLCSASGEPANPALALLLEPSTDSDSLPWLSLLI